MWVDGYVGRPEGTLNVKILNYLSQTRICGSGGGP